MLALTILASPLAFADPSPPLEELEPEQRIEQLWAEQAEWIYETGYEGADTFASVQGG